MIDPDPDHIDAADDESDSGREPESGHDNSSSAQPVEVGGRDGPDPTRFGDWEKGGRCIDF